MLGNYSLYCNKSELSSLTKIVMKHVSARVVYRSIYYRLCNIGSVSENLDFEVNAKVHAQEFQSDR
jgi:hypothetical protein